jgi:2-amino-4-hydroxy-6-hydroxymethyldihydropteridine diphosphokinase
MTDMVTVYLSLGSNLGNREDNLDMALKLLSERMRMGKVSSIYDTEPLGVAEQPRFLNIACEVFTRLTPEGLLSLAKGIEGKMGRRGKTGEPKTIDIDILLYGEKVVNKPDLVIPHPSMAQRSFVLVPLAEIAPNLVHPVVKKKIKEMRDAIKEVQGVMKLDGK